jgi:uncharacterized protein
MLRNSVFVIPHVVVLVLGLMLNAVGAEQKVQLLEWTDLIPKGYNPDDLLAEYQNQNNTDELKKSDPTLKGLMKQLQAMLTESPMNTALNGRLVKLPGYVVPVETDGQKSSEFLLVPYFGACIHVPPPPPNQTVYVKTRDKDGATIRKLYDVVWVTGIIQAEEQKTDLADTGYTIEATKVEPYEKPAVSK